VPPAEIAWGAAFVKLAGASHLVLRISTIVAVTLGALCWRRTAAASSASTTRRRGVGSRGLHC
jgi:hypothetical protein